MVWPLQGCQVGNQAGLERCSGQGEMPDMDHMCGHAIRQDFMRSVAKYGDRGKAPLGLTMMAGLLQ